MNNVVSINSKRFLGFYAQNRKNSFEETFLLTGAILSVALPQIICLAYLGVIPFLMFAGSTLLGGIVGTAMFYNRDSNKKLRIFSETVPEASPERIIKLKKAA